MIDQAKIERAIAAMMASAAAMNVSALEAAHIFAFLHKDAAKRSLVERIWDFSGPNETNIMRAKAVFDDVDQTFADMHISIEEHASSLVQTTVLKPDTILISPDTDLLQ